MMGLFAKGLPKFPAVSKVFKQSPKKEGAEMKITRVSIRPVDMNKVKALASITIDDEFVVHDLRVVEGERGFFVAMPSRKLPNGSHRDIAHPINSEARQLIQVAVLEEYDQIAAD